MRKKKKRTSRVAYSKRLVSDIRSLLWIVTVGGFLLAFYCIWEGYTGSLPWISSMVGLPWAAHGTVCAFYLGMAKSDHRAGGITYDAAKANDFQYDADEEGPTI